MRSLDEDGRHVVSLINSKSLKLKCRACLSSVCMSVYSNTRYAYFLVAMRFIYTCLCVSIYMCIFIFCVIMFVL